MIKAKSNGSLNRILKRLRVPHLETIELTEWPLVVFYIVFTCKYQADSGEQPDPEYMTAFRQLIKRAALRGEPIAPEETVARLMSPDCSGEELAAFIEQLAAGDRVTDQDISELFFSKHQHLRIRIPPKEYAEKHFYK